MRSEIKTIVRFAGMYVKTLYDIAAFYDWKTSQIQQAAFSARDVVLVVRKRNYLSAN